MVESNKSDAKSEISDSQEEARAFAARLQQRAQELHISRANLISWTGIKKQSFAGYWNGERVPPAHALLQLSEELDANPRWLLTGEGQPGRNPRSADLSTSEDEVAIDSLDLSYGMGGTFVDVEPGAMEIEKAKFSRAWLRKFTHSSPELLFTTSGVGDSMRPTIEDRDVVIVDRSASLKDELGEKIWAVVFGGVGMIKRLRPMPDGTVKLMSDNPSVPPEIATDSDLYVVGRVVAVVRRH